MRDGGRAAHRLPARLECLDCGRGDTARIIATVGVEILVLGGNECLLDEIRNILSRGIKAPFTAEFVDDAPLAGKDAADGGRGVIGEALVTGQIAPIDIEDRTDAERDQHDAHGDQAED